MGHMFYNNMGASADYSILTGKNTANLALFSNLQTTAYWSGTAYAPDQAGDAWFFYNMNGTQSSGYQFYEFSVWAFRPGDVAAVPEPEAYAQLLVGLGLLGVVAKRRRRSFEAS